MLSGRLTVIGVPTLFSGPRLIGGLDLISLPPDTRRTVRPVGAILPGGRPVEPHKARGFKAGAAAFTQCGAVGIRK
jgi:hypothetical protein